MNISSLLFTFIIISNYLSLNITNQYFEKITLKSDYKKICFVICQHPLCHKCLQEIDTAINKIERRNFKYFVILDCEENIVKRKTLINFMKNDIKPDGYYFLNNQEFEELMVKFDNKYFPSLFIFEDNHSKFIRYEDIFNDNPQKNINIDSIFLNLNVSN